MGNIEVWITGENGRLKMKLENFAKEEILIKRFDNERQIVNYLSDLGETYSLVAEPPILTRMLRETAERLNKKVLKEIQDHIESKLPENKAFCLMIYERGAVNDGPMMYLTNAEETAESFAAMQRFINEAKERQLPIETL